jgi:hypothetical protein
MEGGGFEVAFGILAGSQGIARGYPRFPPYLPDLANRPRR